jgi:restriction endonuclease S subunit/type I restriction-modification system DNA methylase subunit
MPAHSSKTKQTHIRKESNLTMNPYSELLLPSDPDQRRLYLQNYFEAIHNLLWDRANLSPERALEHLTFFFAYRLIETQADALGLPQECRWSYIAAIKNENDMYEVMKKGCVAFQKNSTTKPFFKKPEIDKAEVLYEMIQQINRIPFHVLQESDTLGDIFEFMLGRGMSTLFDDAQYFTNRAICKLAFKLAYGIKKTLRRPDSSLCTVADWFCGTGGFPAEYVKGVKENLGTIDWKHEQNAVYCQDVNISNISITLLNLLIVTGFPFSSKTIRSCNSFVDPITLGPNAPFKGIAIDYCFLSPPFTDDKSKGKEYKFTYAKKIKDQTGKTVKQFTVNSEIQSIGIEDDDKASASVQLAMSTLADEGVCCILLPQGFFFGTMKKTIELRKKLAEEYKIHYVVDLSSLSTSTKTSMLVFQKGVGPTDTIRFLDMQENTRVQVNLDTIRAKQYSLAYNQYIAQETVEVQGFTTFLLKDVCVCKRGKMITKANLKEGTVPVIGGGLSPMGYHCESNREANTILISQSGENAGAISRYPVPVWASDCFSVESKSENLLNEYLYHILKSIEPSIRALRNGTGQPHVYPSSIEHLSIPVPSVNQQKEIIVAIDGWSNLARHEEEALKMLETQMLYTVKHLGKGHPRIKMREVLTKIKSGKTNSTDASGTGEYPFYGCTAIVPTNTHNSYDFEGDEYLLFAKSGGNAKTRVGESLGIGKFHYVRGKTAGNIAVFQYTVSKDLATTQYVYYLLRSKLEEIQMLADYTTGNGNINVELMYDAIQLALPPLEDQQSLQPEFDEILHKQQKSIYYKRKAQEAIQQFIPTK